MVHSSSLPPKVLFSTSKPTSSAASNCKWSLPCATSLHLSSNAISTMLKENEQSRAQNFFARIFSLVHRKAQKHRNFVSRKKLTFIARNSRRLMQSSPSQETKHCLMDILQSKENRAAFRKFLCQEFSEENLDFWYEIEAYKNDNNFRALAPQIFQTYIEQQGAREVNIDSDIRERIRSDLPTPHQGIFDEAQQHIFLLMEKDSFRRFCSAA